MTDEEFEKLLDRIEAKQQTIAIEQKRLKKLLDKRDANCQHKEMVKKEYYFEGSYNDKACTRSWQVCSCCGMTTEPKVEMHSWYG